MYTRRSFLRHTAGAALLSAVYQRRAFSQPRKVKVGMISEMSGPYAEFGYQFSTAIKAFMARHGSSVDGIEVEIITKDVGGPNPATAHRLAQELIARDKVDFFGGFGFSPNALSVAPMSARAKVPMVVMNASALDIPKKSPYIVRTSTTAVESASVIGKWAAEQKIRTAASLVMDYSSGTDAEEAFIEAYTQYGGRLAGSPIRAPLDSVDFGPYVQRVKDLKPDALFAFTSGGSSGVAFLKELKERRLEDAGIKIIATGDITIEPVLNSAGDAALGIITAYPYSCAHPSAENKAFVDAFLAAGDGKTQPSIFAVSAYDGMAAIYEVVRRLKGNIDGDAAMDVLRGLRLDSPRGPLSISETTRDPVQNVYIRKTERRDGVLANYEFDTVAPA